MNIMLGHAKQIVLSNLHNIHKLPNIFVLTYTQQNIVWRKNWWFYKVHFSTLMVDFSDSKNLNSLFDVIGFNNLIGLNNLYSPILSKNFLVLIFGFHIWFHSIVGKRLAHVQEFFAMGCRQRKFLSIFANIFKAYTANLPCCNLTDFFSDAHRRTKIQSEVFLIIS